MIPTSFFRGIRGTYIGYAWTGGIEPDAYGSGSTCAVDVIERRALTTAKGTKDLQIDLTLVMTGFEFETVWNERREFLLEGVPVPTARLLHIVESKQAAGRPKDQLFLATHKDALEQLLKPRG